MMPWSFEIGVAFALVAAAPATSAAEPMFRDRAVNPDANPADVPQQVRNLYNQMESRRSLLIPVCMPVNEICATQSPEFQKAYGLQGIFSAAVQRANLDLKKTLYGWLEQAGTLQGGAFAPFGSANLTPDNVFQSFQLLAVVNRMDEAAWIQAPGGTTGKWRDAELRFIYGLKPTDHPHFTLIVEFVLPEMDWPAFWKLACRWKELSIEPRLKDAALVQVIEQTGYKKSSAIRIRANCLVNGAQWQFSQWQFHIPYGGKHGTFEMSDLDFQVDPRNIWPSPEATPFVSPKVVQEKFKAFSVFWTDALKTVTTTPVGVPAPLSTKTATYRFSGAFLNPPSTLPFSDRLSTLRRIVALQQCTECHSRETKTPQLQHVSETGEISQFLIGNGNWDPAPEELRSASLEVKVWYCVSGQPPSPDCPSGTKRIDETRYFHDLARRKLFLATLLAAPSTAPGPNDVKAVMNYGPDFIH